MDETEYLDDTPELQDEQTQEESNEDNRAARNSRKKGKNKALQISKKLVSKNVRRTILIYVLPPVAILCFCFLLGMGLCNLVGLCSNASGSNNSSLESAKILLDKNNCLSDALTGQQKGICAAYTGYCQPTSTITEEQKTRLLQRYPALENANCNESFEQNLPLLTP